MFAVLLTGKGRKKCAKEVKRGGSRIGTVELQHPQFPLDIIDNI
jgi:hypothetical protein